MNQNKYDIRDMSLAPQGQIKIDWVARWTPVMNTLSERFKEDGVFQNKRIAMCIHLEAKTAYLALTIQKLGATVRITSSNPLSTKDDIAAALVKNGVYVYAKHGASDQDFQRYIRAICEMKPHVVVDDGGDVSEFLYENSEFGKELTGICEETTSGVNRLRMAAQQNKLRYPAIAINDAASKYLFDNRYGTGQSAWTAIMHLTNMNIAGKIVVIIGYGWVGKGIALRAKGLGAEVIVTEIDPWKALEARMDGFRLMTLNSAVGVGDLFITATGKKHVIRTEHFEQMKNGAFLANAGHFDFEIDVPALRNMTLSETDVREEIREFKLSENKFLYLLAQGGIINIAGGLGHPIEIMDLSFSVQLACIHYLLKSPKLTPDVYQVPKHIDEMVVRQKLTVDGIEIDES